MKLRVKQQRSINYVRNYHFYWASYLPWSGFKVIFKVGKGKAQKKWEAETEDVLWLQRWKDSLDIIFLF